MMEYRPVINDEIDGTDLPSLSPFIHYENEDTSNSNEKESQWSHQKDLDDFFVRIYQYHQKHGFFSIILSEVFGLIQFIFIISFTILIVQCIDYSLLFHSSPYARNTTDKIQIHQIILPIRQCLPNMPLLTCLCLILAIIYWFYRFIRAIYNLFTFSNIRTFYDQVLDIKPSDLSNMTWHEVQQRLLIAQQTHHICIHKSNLTELDIHNRLLRFKNYEIAMTNKGILPPRIRLPFLGEIISFTNGFKFNLRLILFWGPYAPFDQRWHLRQEYKIFSQREILARQLANFILLYGLANLLLSPFIFIWQVLNLFYGYTELIRREPGVLGSRLWSNYGRMYLRHFNELDHSLHQRLNRGYQPAHAYMSSFVNYSLVEIAKFLSFTCGAILAVLVLLTIYDEDVLNVEHMLTLMTGLGVILGICRALIPDENAVQDPEQMLQLVLAQVHYQPETWKNHAHTDYVQAEFGQIFQLKYVYFLEELFSPFLTPIILCFQFRRKSLQIIDFLRNYTVDVQGVGDVCSFAQLDVGKHGDLKWFAPVRPKSNNEAGITNDGKLELSLMHFHHTNPRWQMPKQCEVYLETIQERAVENMQTSSILQQSVHQMQQSFHHNSIPLSNSSRQHTLLNTMTQSSSKVDLPYQSLAPFGVLSRLQSQIFNLADTTSSLIPGQGTTQLDMNISCLFMHELRHKYKHGEYETLEHINENQNDDNNSNSKC